MIHDEFDAVEATTDRLYRALASGDTERVNRCYAARACYSDPILGDLEAGSARRVWPVIFAHARRPRWRFQIEVVGLISARVRTHIEYEFAPTGRLVSHEIKTRLSLRDGLVVHHDDEFDLGDWSSMAFHRRACLNVFSPFGYRQLSQHARRSLAQLEEMV